MNAEKVKDVKERWSLVDLVDFEYFLIHTSSKQNPGESAQQARNWFQLHVSDHSQPGHAVKPKPAILKMWLRHQKAQQSGALPSPGETWQWLIGMLHWLFLFIGIVTGAGVTAGLLTYDGRQPINVAMFIGILVGGQLLWSVVSFLLIASRGLQWIPLQSGLSFRLFHLLLHWASVRLHRHVITKLATEKRMVWESFWRHLQKDHGSSGKYLIWPIVSKIQLLGVAFNLGALAIFVTSVLFRDLAFGWQTSMQQVNDASVAMLVKVLSFPWSWIWGEGQGFPSLAQIEGSRIILKEGIGFMQNPNLTSWWPFLLMSLFVYGFLPRTMLWVWVIIKGREQLACYPFESVSCLTLWKRFQTPFLNVTRRLFDHHSDSADGALASSVAREKTHTITSHSNSIQNEVRCWVLLNEDLTSTLSHSQLTLQLSPHGWHVEGILEGEFLKKEYLASRLHGGDCLLWLEEAWQPPIQEKMKRIQNCREALPDGVLLCIGLIGKPNGDSWLTPVRPRDLEIWTKFVFQNHPEGVQVRSVLIE